MLLYPTPESPLTESWKKNKQCVRRLETSNENPRPSSHGP